MKKNILLVSLCVICIGIAIGWGLDHYTQGQLVEKESPTIGAGGVLQTQNRNIWTLFGNMMK